MADEQRASEGSQHSEALQGIDYSTATDPIYALDRRVRRIGRALMIVALLSMIGAVVISVLRGDDLPLTTLAIFVVWGGWMVYMVFKSQLFNKV